jgi:hypothetical protein
MNMTLIKWVTGALVVGGALAGCTSNTPRLDASFGEAVAMARAQQTLNPDASSNADPVAGMDGVAAQGAMDRYNKSFKQPPAPVNVFNIGIGSSAGGAR